MAIGHVRVTAPYPVEMAPGFTPWRRHVDWQAAQPTPMAPLLGRLEWTAGQHNWGFRLRFCLFPISAHDMEVIADAMSVARTLPSR